jgi:DNA/RNA endonuclease YhcR with UshA esterase domain
MFCRVLLAAGLVSVAGFAVGQDRKALTPVEARKKVGEKITVEMTVRAAKDRLEKRGEIYFDSELDFRAKENFAVVITKSGAASLRKAGIDSPAKQFKDKKIRATGLVKEVQGVPRIEIDDAQQIRVVSKE